MARYGGKYSPKGSGTEAPPPAPGAFAHAGRDPVGARSNVLFVPPVILAIRSINDGATGLAVGLVGAGAMVLGAWLLRDGLRAEAAYNSRKIARRPAIPRKMFAAVLAGIGVAFAAWKVDPGPGLLAPAIYGVAATALHLGAFGLDPLRNKGMDGVETFQQDRVARVVDEAETYLADMSDAARRARDREVESAVDRFRARAAGLIRTVEDDPRDLTAARKYLGVYLMGARDAAVKFADIYARSRDGQARADFLALLGDLDRSFGAKTQKLLLDSNSDLTIEIEVLRDRLKREGVRL